MENRISVNNKGVESAGLTKDYKEAIAEYIWNAFDASASKVIIQFTSNEIDTLQSFEIIDNGSGICYDTLSSTFGNFLDSVKNNSFQRSSYLHGKKGKGRFSFSAFAGKAIWRTISKDSLTGKLIEYDITITKSKKDTFKDDNKKVSSKKETGTKVTFSELFELTAYHLQSEEFKAFLAMEFGWFLFLNKDLHYELKINQESIEYKNIIAENEIIHVHIKDHEETNHNFKVTYLRWTENIGDKFYFYFLNSDKREIAKELTSFNNNAIGFFHSIYIESSFFDSFNQNNIEQSGNLFENTRNNSIFKSLMSRLQIYVKEKQKIFLRGEAADKLITKYETEGILPKFKTNKYDQERRSDLIGIVKSIYCIEPRIFLGLNREQQKVNVGLINLLLDSDERNNVIELLGQIVNMTAAEREELTCLLKKTTLSKVVKAISLVESRYKVIELLKSLVFDLKIFTNERDHIQKIIEENYWLFGEQYHLISANEGFEKLLNHYIKTLNVKPETRKSQIKSVEKNRRPDVFVCRKHCVPDILDHETEMEENVIIELKRPTVQIGKTELRQIEDYCELIINEDSFNSQKRFWKFYVVSNTIDQFTKNQYLAFKDKGKRFLVKAISNYEIYALSWDDIFTSFNLRHHYLIDKLEFDKNVLRDELNLRGINLSKDGSTAIKDVIIDIST